MAMIKIIPITQELAVLETDDIYKNRKIDPVVGIREAYVKKNGYRFGEGPDDPMGNVADYMERTEYMVHCPTNGGY